MSAHAPLATAAHQQYYSPADLDVDAQTRSSSSSLAMAFGVACAVATCGLVFMSAAPTSDNTSRLVLPAGQIARVAPLWSRPLGALPQAAGPTSQRSPEGTRLSAGYDASSLTRVLPQPINMENYATLASDKSRVVVVDFVKSRQTAYPELSVLGGKNAEQVVVYSFDMDTYAAKAKELGVAGPSVMIYKDGLKVDYVTGDYTQVEAAVLRQLSPGSTSRAPPAAPAASSSEVEVMTGAEYDAKLARGGKQVVYFTAPWCGPCKRVTPIVKEMAAEMDDVSFFVYDITTGGNEKAKSLGIRAIPYFILYRDGKEVVQFGTNKPYELKNTILENFGTV